ncbi:hypothetical protein AAVH_14244 [Aphelenchoides avenae]|nr:hypothetical protein AAVH_14244 [Aphelenchus avenae]
MWVDASQGSQRVPVKVAPLNAAVDPNPAYLKSLGILSGGAQHPSQYDIEEESDAAEGTQEGTESEGSQRTDNDASFYRDQQVEDEESEVRS